MKPMENVLRFISKMPTDMIRKNHLVLLDYDGTLTSIMDRPGRARLSGARKRKLIIISKKKRIKIGLVTGRSLCDIKGLLGGGVLISANHGFEVCHKGKVLYPLGKSFKKPMDELGKALTGHLDRIPGLLLESKGFSVAVHYRMVPGRYWDDIERIVKRVSAPWRRRYGWRLTRGKKLWEVRPSSHWNKGDAVLWMWKKFAPDAVPWYFGDDLTDEDAFRSFKGRGITVIVGRRMRSHARYFARNVAEVWQALRSLSAMI